MYDDTSKQYVLNLLDKEPIRFADGRYSTGFKGVGIAKLKKGDKVLYLGYVEAVVLRRAGNGKIDIKALPNGCPKRVLKKECEKM